MEANGCLNGRERAFKRLFDDKFKVQEPTTNEKEEQ